MRDEKRKSLRSKCLLPAKIIDTEGTNGIIKGISVCDFSPEGFKLVITFNLKPSSGLKTKIHIPEKQMTTSISGEIVWTNYTNDRLELGVKIKDMDENEKQGVLDFVLPHWVDTSS
jgi:hypothetical protein